MSPMGDKGITAMTLLQIRLLGLATIGEALLFKLAFARLAAGFDDPDILLRLTEELRARFAAGGPGLILDWYGLAASALLMVPLALGLAQAIGLLR